MTTVKPLAWPRMVTGMPAAAGPATAEVMPGTTDTSTPALRRASASSPPRPKTNGSPPLRRTTVSARPRGVDQHVVDPVLGVGRSAGTLADVDHLGPRGDQVKDPWVHQPVVDDHVGGFQQLQGPQGEQVGIAGAGSDQVDGHSTAPSG